MPYLLEFNEEQQCFHNNDGRSTPNTFGWFTVLPECTDGIFYAFKAYINYKPNAIYTKSQMEDLAHKFQRFSDNLHLYALAIVDLKEQD